MRWMWLVYVQILRFVKMQNKPIITTDQKLFIVQNEYYDYHHRIPNRLDLRVSFRCQLS